MMKTFPIFIALISLLTLQTAMAAPDDWLESNSRFGKNRDISDFQEATVALPAVPDAHQGDWYELYISPIFQGKPRILLSSIQTVEDGSIRYVFNNRSAVGYDNISAEGIFCISGTQLLYSEGSKIKTFAYADTVNQRWIEPRKADWTILGGARNSTDQVRHVLYRAFCQDGKARNDDELRQRVRDYGSSRPYYH